MSKTPLYDVLASSGAQMGEYSGVDTARSFGEVAREFRELASGCAVYDLGWRAKVVINGEDRVRWLNGMVTNNIKDLPLNQGNYSFILNPQGRILGDLYTYNRGDYLLIDTERSQLENLLKLFEHFIIMDDVQVTDKSAALTAIGIQGPNAGTILEKAAIHDPGLKPMQLADLTWNGIDISVTRMASDEFVTYELWLATANAAQLWKALVQAGGVPVGSEALEKFRVMIGFPKYGIDIRERDLPQETEQDHALNFTKGCYIGQEIVERIRSRGAVHRTFRGFLLNGELPGNGSKLAVDVKDVGEITSVSRIPAQDGEHAVALGYIRREVLERGAKITYPGGEAKPSELPFSLAS
jgi:folate-binding protein YgfZ